MGVGSSLSAFRSPALFELVSGQDWELFLRSLAVMTGMETAADIDSFVSLYKQAYDQADFFLMAGVAGAIPLIPLLERQQTPTLVLHPRQYSLLTPEEPMKVARLARARFVTVDGPNPATLNPEQGLRAIESFLADLPARAPIGAGQRPGDLSARELEVLRLLAQGKSNPQIAEALVITRNTVQNHVSSILIKLNLQNRAQAAVYAKEHGIV